MNKHKNCHVEPLEKPLDDAALSTAMAAYLAVMVQAATEEGETATADLTVTAPTAEASAGPATVQEPSGEPHLIDRTKPLGQIVVVGVLIALSVAAGFALLRSQG
jgi:hypothetical protein